MAETNHFDRPLFCIQYPGLVNNELNAIETLGGLKKISQVNSVKTSRLQLRFRKNDPYCKAASSTVNSCVGILLRIKVKKKKKHPENSVVISTNVVGIVNAIHTFETLADFQYLPMIEERSDDSSPYITKNILNELKPDGIVDIDWLNLSQQYFLVPSLFSQIDCPQKYAYRTNPNNKTLNVPHNVIGELRKSRQGFTTLASFSQTDPTPTTPTKKAQDLMGYIAEESFQKIKNLYEERPIWSRSALLYLSKLSYPVLKNILLNVAYYYMNGPWRCLWVKLGYDPRQDPQSRIYQNIDFRIRNTGVLKSIANEHFGKIDENAYIFRPGIIPPRKQMLYQYCDLKVPEIEEMLSKLGEVLPGSLCNERRGWMPTGFDDQCRNILNTFVISKMRESIIDNSTYSIQMNADENQRENIEIEVEDVLSDYDDEESDDNVDCEYDYDIDQCQIDNNEPNKQ